MKEQTGVDVQLYPYLTSVLEVGGWSAPCLGHFTRKKNPVLLEQVFGWASWPVVMVPKIPAPTRV